MPVTLNGQGGDELLSRLLAVLLRTLAAARRGRRFSASGHATWAGACCPAATPNSLRQVPWMIRRYQGSPRVRRATARGPVEQARRMYGRAMARVRDPRTDVAAAAQVGRPQLHGFSVEGRYPFLDHEMIELCLSFAPRVLYDRGWTKEPLRRGLVGLLPPEILRRRSKLGFETPQDRWLVGPLAAAGRFR